MVLAFSDKENIAGWINAANVTRMILVVREQQHCNHINYQSPTDTHATTQQNQLRSKLINDRTHALCHPANSVMQRR